MSKDKLLARLAGVCYLIVAITGFFCHDYIRRMLYDFGNLEITTRNTVTNQNLIVIGTLSEILMVVTWTMLAYLLYQLFNDAKAACLDFGGHYKDIFAEYIGNSMFKTNRNIVFRP